MKIDLKVNDKCQFMDPKTGKTLVGYVHGVRRVDLPSGKQGILSYLIDTGKTERIDVVQTLEGLDDLLFRQPQLIDVRPENIKGE